MNILSPLTKVEEVEPLIKAGADELYCGIISDKWKTKFGDITCLGRYESSQPNFNNFKELKRAIEIADTYNKPIFLTVNAPYYSKRQFKIIDNDINKAINIGIKALIVADLGLLLKLYKNGTNIPLIISGLGTTFNIETLKFYKEFGVRRIILPRHLTLDEIRAFYKYTKQVELETFVLNGRCANDEGFCTFHHRLNVVSHPKRKKFFDKIEGNFELINLLNKIPKNMLKFITSPAILGEQTIPCRLNYKVNCNFNDHISNEKKIKIQKIVKSRFSNNFKRVIHTSCGVCALHDFLHGGIKSVKIVGRTNHINKKLMDVRFISKLLNILEKNNCSKAEFIKTAKNRFKQTYREECLYSRCYYPEYFNY